MADAAAEPWISWRAWRAGRGWGIVLPVVAAIPALRAVARAVRVGWVPIADEGVIALRAHDVLTGRTPALGQMSLASGTSGAPTRSPGPMGYWVLAPAAQVGPLWLVAAAAGVVAVVAVVATVHLAGRRGGLPLAGAVTLGLALSARAFDPVNLAVGWNPSIGLAPMALLVLLAWSVGVGERGWFPVTVAVGCFVAQLHVAYLLPGVVAVGFAAVAGWGPDLVAHLRARGPGPATGPATGPARDGPPLRPLVLGGALGLLLWAGPLLQQLADRPGNMVLVARSTGGETAGVGVAARALAWSIGVPPAWTRGKASGLDALVRLGPPWPSVTTLTAAALVVALVVLATVGLRRREREVAVPPLLVLALLATALLVLRATPTDARGVSIVYTTWWLIPVGMLAWVAVGAAVLRLVPRPSLPPSLGPIAAGVVVVLTTAIAVGTPIRDPEDHMYGVARTVGDAVVDEVRPGGRYEVGALGAVGFQLASGIAYRIRRDGGHPVIRGGDGVSAGPEYVPRGVRCDAVIAVVPVGPGRPPPRWPEDTRVLLWVDIPPGPAVDDRRAALTWAPDHGPPSC